MLSMVRKHLFFILTVYHHCWTSPSTQFLVHSLIKLSQVYLLYSIASVWV